MRSTRRFLELVVIGGTLTACGTTPTAATGPISVKATDTTCEAARTTLDAGTHVFSVANSGTKVTEFYVYAEGDRVMGEIENITPGLSRELRVELPAGKYQTACKPGMMGNGIRATLTVAGSAAPLTEDAALAQATASYSRYVASQCQALVEKTADFVAAVKAGDVAKSKALFPVARTYWERIEPVAEIFGDLDPRIDGREDRATADLPFTGFHWIEKDLWITGDISRDGPLADQLMADIRKVAAKARAEKLSPLQLANGAKELLDEVATGKITGEEDRYSHTDLWDFAANLDGSQAAVAALRPALVRRDPSLVHRTEAGFRWVREELAKHRTDDGWKPHDTLTQPQLKALSDAINVLAEAVSRIGGVVAAK